MPSGVCLLFGSPFHPGLKVPRGCLVCRRQPLGPFFCLLSCPFPSRYLVLRTLDVGELKEYWVERRKRSRTDNKLDTNKSQPFSKQLSLNLRFFPWESSVVKSQCPSLFICIMIVIEVTEIHVDFRDLHSLAGALSFPIQDGISLPWFLLLLLWFYWFGSFRSSFIFVFLARWTLHFRLFNGYQVCCTFTAS